VCPIANDMKNLLIYSMLILSLQMPLAFHIPCSLDCSHQLNFHYLIRWIHKSKNDLGVYQPSLLLDRHPVHIFFMLDKRVGIASGCLWLVHGFANLCPAMGTPQHVCPLPVFFQKLDKLLPCFCGWVCALLNL